MRAQILKVAEYNSPSFLLLKYRHLWTNDQQPLAQQKVNWE